jgi:hypothetical protein
VPVGLYVKLVLLHAVVACELIVATGFTVTLTVKAAALQLPGGEVGVTLYTAVAAVAEVLVRSSFMVL